MVYDPYEELAGAIASLREDMKDIFSSKEQHPIGLFSVNTHDILRVLSTNVEELRKEIVELTGAIWELVNNE